MFYLIISGSGSMLEFCYMWQLLRRKVDVRGLGAVFGDRERIKRWVQPRNLSWAFVLLVALGVLSERLGILAQNIYAHARYFEGFAIDGTFQIFNPLRRLAAGQVPGVDFQFFHGLGTLLVHYPLFALFGGNLYASELSRNLISPLFFFVSAGVLLYVATKRLVATIVGLAILLVFFPLMSVIMISNGSLLGVRSTMPLLVAASLIWLHRQVPGSWQYVTSRLVTLTLLALSFVMSVEHGMAAIVAYVLMEFVFAKGSWLKRGLVAARDGAAVLMIMLFGFIVISGPRFLEPIVYALRDIPGDQFWYFGVLPSPYVLSFKDLLHNQTLTTYLFMTLVLLVVFWRIRRPELAAEKRGFIFLLVYGAMTPVAILGIDSPTYLQPLARVILISIICLAYWWFRENVTAPRKQATGLFGFGLVFLITCLMVQAPSDFTQLPTPSLYSPQLTLGAHLGPRWGDYMKIMNETIPRGASLWSTYANVAEAERKIFNPSGYDYIIHALGPERRPGYVQRFTEKKPDFVTTVRRRYSAYEEWLELEHWPWYEQLLVNYDYRKSTPFSHIWQRKEGDWRDPSKLGWIETINKPGNNVRLAKLPQDLPDGSVVTVEVRYKAHSWLGWVPLIGKMPRYLVEGHDTGNQIPASLPPYERTWQFPVIAKKGAVPRLDFYIGSPVPGGRLEVESVRYRVVPMDEAARKALIDRKPKVPPKPALAEWDVYEPDVDENDYTIDDTPEGSAAQVKQNDTTDAAAGGEGKGPDGQGPGK
jgi:hypothetical protein